MGDVLEGADLGKLIHGVANIFQDGLVVLHDEGQVDKSAQFNVLLVHFEAGALSIELAAFLPFEEVAEVVFNSFSCLDHDFVDRHDSLSNKGHKRHFNNFVHFLFCIVAVVLQEQLSVLLGPLVKIAVIVFDVWPP